MAVLSAASRLPDELSFALRRNPYGLLVSDLRSSHIGAALEFPEEPVHNNLEVKLSHAGDNRLSGLFVKGDPKRRIHLGEFRERLRKLFLISLCLRLNSDRHDRI